MLPISHTHPFPFFKLQLHNFLFPFSSTCQLSGIICESHACGLKTSISRIEDNFSCLTHKSRRVVLKKLHFISDFLCIISLLFITIAKAFKCLQSFRIVSVQRSSKYLWTFSVTFRKTSEIFGSGSDVFRNPGHDETKISCI